MNNDIPLSLYIHVPWCVRKCPYCDFNSHAQQGELPQAAYVAALLDDLRQDAGFIQGRSLHSIFIGGGTPSLFSADAYEQLLAGIRQHVPFASDIEITMEANPGTFEQQKFNDYRRVGFNRLSIGIQSFDAAQLKQLGRIHDRDEALRAAAIARDAGFDNFNLDLMFGLPGQRQQQALADLQQAIECNPTHLSWYQLTIEPNTEFFSRPPALPPDDAIADMQEAGIALLARNGFARYEISAFSRPGKASRHNLNYWQFGDYLGIGAGAHGKLTTLSADGSLHLVRTRKTRMPQHYMSSNGAYCVEHKQVLPAELPFEFMMNALRLCNGVPATLFTPRTGVALPDVLLDKLRNNGLLQTDSSRLAASRQGLAHLNTLLLEFL